MYLWDEEIISHFQDTYVEIDQTGKALWIILLTPDNYSYNKEKFFIKKEM